MAGSKILPLVEAGFSLEDINALYWAQDIRTFGSVLSEVRKWNAIRQLRTKLDIADALNYAFVGSQYDKRGANVREYRRWRRQLLNEIDKLEGNLQTVWDNMKRRSRRLGR